MYVVIISEPSPSVGEYGRDPALLEIVAMLLVGSTSAHDSGPRLPRASPTRKYIVDDAGDGKPICQEPVE